MTNLQEMQALQDAHVILHRLSCQVAAGTPAVWTILRHAQQHINRRMTDLLGENLEESCDGLCPNCGRDVEPGCNCQICNQNQGAA